MVTIIIPAYNCENTIEKCLWSVLLQTYRDLEVVVVNDGSTDSTEILIQAICKIDDRVKLINQENSGVSSARNRGIESACGMYIGFVDSDDYIEPTFVEKLVSLCQSDVLPVVNYVYNENTSAVLPLVKSIEHIQIIKESLDEEFFIGEMGRKIAFSVWNKLFCKDVIIKNSIRFDTKLKVSEDQIFVFQYLSYCESISVSCQPLYHYMIRPDSTINSTDVDFAPQYEDAVSVMKSLKVNGLYIKRKVLARWALKVTNYVLLNEYVSSKKYNLFRKYFDMFINLELAVLASENEYKCEIKEKIMQYIFKKRNSLMMFVLIKFNRLYHKLLSIL